MAMVFRHGRLSFGKGMKPLTVIVVVCILVGCNGVLRKKLFDRHGPLGVVGEGDPGNPLYLTPLIKAGKLDEAKAQSKVGPLPNISLTSHAGYLTVNESCDSNMFFWFFPAESGDPNAPVLLWLQGGPGGTSMFGLFVENGPFYLDDNLMLNRRAYAWTKSYSVLYIDNPVGTGFSFTGKDECYAANEDDVARDLYSALNQFFQVFHEHQPNDFYATGESYAGKYVPAISLKIHQENQQFPNLKINLKGMIIGDGLCDPETMFPAYAPFMYNIGLLDENQEKYFATWSEIAVGYIRSKNFKAAFTVFDRLLNGDLTGYKAWFYNQTGLDFYYNYLLAEAPKEFDYFNKFLPQVDIRKSIHVGNKTFNDGSKVEMMIMNDVMDTVKPRVTQILDNGYKVLMYSGMLDIIVALPLTEAFLNTVPWQGLDGYKNATRQIWKMEDTDVDVAGYVRIYKNLVQVGVRGGGHILPYDQPARAFRLVDVFISQFNP
ncbi:CPVL [Bugula neritina]|uniref:CPVL n=1 Tax=Bugula neritina TaxID=10212 RepID=A0A7J7JDW8_BUGNE|nr:CPVL [Bugula neritina]